MALLLAIVFAVIAQLLFKSFTQLQLNTISDYIFNPQLIGGLALYFISAILYIYSLKKIELSIAYPSISISYIGVLFLSYILFNEALTINKLAGTFIIVLGVILLWL